MVSRKVLEWLLEEDQPSVRYLALRHLVGRPESDGEVAAAHRAIPERGWAAEILARRTADGLWEGSEDLYRPKYTATNWQLLMLSDLAVTRATPGIEAAAERWMERFPLTGGGFGGNSRGTGHHCLAGNMVRALGRFGYGDDPRLRVTLEWLVKTADPKGGWSCWGKGRNLDSWEGLSAFAAIPRASWSEEMGETVERAAEFFLDRELSRQGARYPPWFRFHYPVHYYYDVLVGLDLLTSLGYSGDRRLGPALSLLKRRRRSDGRWNLAAWHPDVTGSMARWYVAHPKDRPTPVGLERPGEPSKMITLTALRVLDRVERAG